MLNNVSSVRSAIEPLQLSLKLIHIFSELSCGRWGPELGAGSVSQQGSASGGVAYVKN